jgi:hypothetical protein
MGAAKYSQAASPLPTMQRVLLALTLLLLIPGGLAQPTPVDPIVGVSISAVDDGASLDTPAIYTVTITNDSPGTGSGQDQPMSIVLRVTSNTPGWTASLQETAFQVAPGESATTTLTVAVTASADRDATTVSVTATITSGTPPLQRTATASDSVEVLRDDSSRRVVTEAIGDYIWYIVGGGVLLYIVSSAIMVSIFRKKEKGNGKS